MESKTKHRMLGIVVVIGLVIASIPLFQGRKDLPSEPILVKAPPFPDQAVQITTSESEEISSSEQTSSVTPQSSLSSKDTHKQNAESLLQSVNPSVVNSKKTDIQKLDRQINHAIDQQQIQNTANVKLTTNGELNKDRASPSKSKTSPEINFTKPHRMDQSPSLSSHLKLQNTGWVVQIGSFKDKSNALKIVNRLRENGYKAFFKEVSTTTGNNTRVFVGPENKQTTARNLASRLEADLKIHGIIVTYKPLAL